MLPFFTLTLPDLEARSKSYCTSCRRDKSGRIARRSSARTAFKKANPCPATGKSTGPCRGYVIDHRVPLKRGGADHSVKHAVADARGRAG